MDCDDHDPCTVDTCDQILGCVHTPNLLPCDDGLVAVRTEGMASIAEAVVARWLTPGLATRDPVHTSSADWEYERQLAGSLLSDTRLYRRAAEQRGLNDVARVMGDLETVLLETSLGDHTDPESLERVQQLIRKRDLVVKMQVIGGSGI